VRFIHEVSVSMRAIDWIAKHAQYTPDQTAIIELWSGRRITYREFDQEVHRVTRLLRELGVRVGDRVSVLLSNSADVLFVLFAAWRTGVIFVPLNHKVAVPELAGTLADAQPSVVLHNREFDDLVEGLSSQQRFVGLQDALKGIGRELTEPASSEMPDAEAPQMILYTSGTTGRPKGVILSHRMILWNSINTSLRMLTIGDTVLVHTPMFYTGGLNVYTLPNFFLGGTVAIMRSFQADDVLRLVRQREITGMFGVPTQLQMMADCESFSNTDFSGLHFLFSGGAPCPIPLIERYAQQGARLQQGFGLTEVGPNCFANEKRDYLRKAGSIGYPNFAMEARILGENGLEVPRGEVGELALRSQAMFSGYWNNAELTSQVMRDGWFLTGDLAACDEDGCFRIAGRKKDMFISGGENVYPAEVENVLRLHPQIAEVAVVGIPDEKWGEVGLAAVIMRSDEVANERGILDWCVGKIGKFKIPKAVLFLDQLPRTDSGKVNKAQIRARFCSGENFSAV
jgi:fatty-acyl-CoA synthase